MDLNVSSGDTEERGWRTSMFTVETPRREDGGFKCFQWRHQGERMEESNVSSRYTKEKGRKTPILLVETLTREN